MRNVTMDGASLLVMLPELILIGGACLVLLVGVPRRGRGSALVLPLALGVLLAACLAFCLGNRPVGVSPFPGLLLSPLSHFVRGAALLVGVLILLVNWHQPERTERGDYSGMILFSLSGVLLTACANDLLVLFLALELVSIPTYVLVALSRTDDRAPEGSLKYFFLGSLAAAILAYGFSFLYGVVGSTVLAASQGPSLHDLATLNGSIGGIALIGLVLAFGALFFKIAAVPFHAYAPDVYEGAASPITGLLGFLPKLAGFVALIKISAALDWHLPDSLAWMLWLVAAASMTVGNVLALLQTNVKRILAYSSIAHTGYMLIGLLVGPAIAEGPFKDGVAALLFYIVVYGVMNLGAFAVLAALEVEGRSAETLEGISGLNRRHPWLACVLALSVFSLMGFPPTAGFIGKLFLFTGAFSTEAGHPFRGPLIVLTVIAVVNTAISAAYYLRIAAACYLGESKKVVRPTGGLLLRFGIAACSLSIVALFLIPGRLADQAGIAGAATSTTAVAAEGATGSGSPPAPVLASDDQGRPIHSAIDTQPR